MACAVNFLRSSADHLEIIYLIIRKKRIGYVVAPMGCASSRVRSSFAFTPWNPRIELGHSRW